MTTVWLLVVTVIVMAAGFVGTMIIGLSKSNNEENTGYSQQSKGKWMRLSWIYLIGIIIVVAIFILLKNR